MEGITVLKTVVDGNTGELEKKIRKHTRINHLYFFMKTERAMKRNNV